MYTIFDIFRWICKIKNTRIQTLIWIFIFSTVVFEGTYIQSNSQDISKLSSSEQYLKDRAWSIDIEDDFKSNKQAYLINFTAAWCITCQANDKIALSRPKVKQYMKENNIEYIVADWTNKNDEILMALEKYNRNGVPLYIYWKPGMKESKILPAILTEKLILDIFKLN